VTATILRKIWTRARLKVRRDGFIRVEIASVPITVPVRSEYFLHYYHHGTYEPETVDLMRRYLRPDDGMLDVGANAGLFTLLASRLVGPSGWVTAIEPDPRSVMLLESNIRAARLANVAVWPVALGQAAGLGLLRQADDSMYSTMMPVEVAQSQHGTVAVQYVSIAEVCRNRNVADIRMIKLDAEGSELQIMRGAQNYLRDVGDDCLIVCEFNPGFYEESTGGMEALAREFSAGGFALHRLDETGRLVPISVGQITASINVVACRDATRANRHLDNA
jgi:FkbM family methyltransferase